MKVGVKLKRGLQMFPLTTIDKFFSHRHLKLIGMYLYALYILDNCCVSYTNALDRRFLSRRYYRVCHCPTEKAVPETIRDFNALKDALTTGRQLRVVIDERACEAPINPSMQFVSTTDAVCFRFHFLIIIEY
jgi:hypothetical protein